MCGRPQPGDVSNLLIIGQAFDRQKLPMLADGLLTKHGKDSLEARKFLLDVYRKRIDAAWPGLGARLELDNAWSRTGLYRIGLDLPQVTRLDAIEGMPITMLNLHGSAVQDLSPLRGMPLTWLNLDNCRGIRSLEALEGLPLTQLYMWGCTQIDDLKSLRGMKLTDLSVKSCSGVHDLGPLEGMPLRNLDMFGVDKVVDLTPLRGSPLRKLALAAYPKKPYDLTPLEGVPLDELWLEPNRVAKGMDVLRGMKSLKTIVLHGNRGSFSASDFWKKYDAGEFK